MISGSVLWDYCKLVYGWATVFSRIDFIRVNPRPCTQKLFFKKNLIHVYVFLLDHISFLL